jgi:allantoin racemase
MSRFLVINPNTNEVMTQEIEKTVKAYIHKDNEVDVIKNTMGPESLESFYEYELAATGLINTIGGINIESYDGVLIACFGDPGLYALKEIIRVPVFGIAEISLSTSILLGDKFAILTAQKKAVPMMSNMVRQYGLKERLAGIYSLGISVLDLEKDKDETFNLLVNTAQKAVDNGAEVIILGCAGLTGFNEKLEKFLSITVIDPVKTGFKIMEAIVESNIKIARNGLYKPPNSKKIIGMEFIKLL